MTAMWFGLAAIALAGAVALLYIDRTRRDKYGRVRQMWAKAQGYDYTAEDDGLLAGFGRAALAKPEFTTALDVVTGTRRGEEFVLFDVEETATIVAVRRQVGSDVDIDLRSRTTPPPREPDMELLGSVGPRVVFATDTDIARRVCDQRMVAFTEGLPPHIQLLWSENRWTLGSIPLTSAGREWDSAIDVVARLSGMLHVLPPVSNRQAYSAETRLEDSAREPRSTRTPGPDPRAPRPRSQDSPPRQDSIPRRGPERTPEPRIPEPRISEPRGPERTPEPRTPGTRGPEPRGQESGPVEHRSSEVRRVQPPRPPREAPARDPQQRPRPTPADSDRRRPERQRPTPPER